MPTLTAHMLIQNEDRFVWFALQSILPFIDQILITDNGSTDKTLEIIQTINSPKIKLTKLPPTDRAGLVTRRRDQIKKTKTDWFMLIDGDEIWPESNFQKMLKAIQKTNKQTMALACRTRNVVGDIQHYQPESAGQYQILGMTGHLTLRFFRHHSQVKLQGEYPLEAYTYQGKPLQNQPDHLEFVDTWYLHTTHLPRSTNIQASRNVIDRLKKYKLETGIYLSKSELPEVFSQTFPKIVPDPFQITYTPLQQLAASTLTPIKNLRRQIVNLKR